MTTRRIQHVSIPVSAEAAEEVARFYEVAFGMQRIRGLAARALWLTFGAAEHVHLLIDDVPGHPRAHLALHVDNLAATLVRLRSLDAPLEEADRLWGAERWFALDPAGNRIEVFQEAPGR